MKFILAIITAFGIVNAQQQGHGFFGNNFGQVATGGTRGGRGGSIVSRGPLLGSGAQSVANANSGHGGTSNANAQATHRGRNLGLGVFNQGIFRPRGGISRATSNANSGNFGVSNANSQANNFGNGFFGPQGTAIATSNANSGHGGTSNANSQSNSGYGFDNDVASDVYHYPRGYYNSAAAFASNNLANNAAVAAAQQDALAAIAAAQQQAAQKLAAIKAAAAYSAYDSKPDLFAALAAKAIAQALASNAAAATSNDDLAHDFTIIINKGHGQHRFNSPYYSSASSLSSSSS